MNSPGQYSLLTDLYEFTMLHAYDREGMRATAVFDLFVRKLPENRNFLLAAGLEDALHFLENLAFDEEQIAYLAGLPPFRNQDLGHLRDFRFTGNVRAVPEGTPVFAGEPLLEIEAPIAQAQVVETFLLNQVTLQTMAASKAARVVHAAGDATVIDFGLRRMHGIDAGMKSARAFYLAGIDATSNVAAGRTYGIPVSGTMAHSYIQAHAREADAFRQFCEIYPETVLLVDTYDTREGVRNVIRLARELGDAFRVKAVRLDSGNLQELSTEARRMLDDAGLQQVGLFVSGGLDEYAIGRLRRSGAPINGYGVGTGMGVSEDAPALDTVYKLVEYGGEGRIKLSPEKGTLPGGKQIFRTFAGGIAQADLLAGADEKHEGAPLLREVMRDGRRVETNAPDLETLRSYARDQMNSLPEAIRAIEPAGVPYPVSLSPGLTSAREKAVSRLQNGG